MANRSLEKKLAKAEKAYQRLDKRQGARLIIEILESDINHAGAWELLYQIYGKDHSLEEFRRLFTARFYPDRVDQLLPIPIPAQATSQVQNGELTAEDHLIGQMGSASPSEPAGPTAPSSPPAFHPLIEAETPVGIIQPARKSSDSSDKIRLVLADDISQTRETIIRTLRFEEKIELVGIASNGLQAVQLARELRPDVIMMDVNMPEMDGITATAAIKRDVPITEIIILTVQDDFDYMRRAMLAGARDFLAKPPMIDDMIQAVLRAGEQARQNRLRLPVALNPFAAPFPGSTGNIVSIYSPRGGSGSTLLAVNLAYGLHREDKPVVLVDANLQFGDVPVLFNTMSKNSILDLTPRVDELDPEIVNEVLMAHPSGVKVLHPPHPERAELVTGPQLSQLLKYLSDLFACVVVDTTHRLSETTMAALDASTLILLVSSLDIPSIARTRAFLELVPTFNLDLKRISLVVNQFDRRVGIGEEKLAQAFGLEPSVIIPMAYATVIASVNRGVPILARRETAQRPVGQAITRLVQHVKTRMREAERIVVRA